MERCWLRLFVMGNRLEWSAHTVDEIAEIYGDMRVGERVQKFTEDAERGQFIRVAKDELIVKGVCEMLYPICTDCNAEMVVDRNGVLMVWTAGRPPRPYKGCSADRYICPCCGRRVVTGFAEKMSHREELMGELFTQMLKAPADVHLAFEFVSQSQKFANRGDVLELINKWLIESRKKVE